jgi:hypothetical protein
MFEVRHLVVSAAVVCLLAPAFASADAPAGGDPLKFGAPVTVAKAVNLAKLAKNPAKFAGQTVRLEGTVKNVCQGKGCWVEVAARKGKSFIAKSLDESILLPKDCQGRRIVVQGLVTTMPAESHEEPAAEGHVCPQPKYVVSTQGVELAAAR